MPLSMHLPGRRRTALEPSLIVSVDTEEEGLWNGIFRRGGYTTENLRGLPRFQAFCERFGVRPTYLVDTPVLEDRRATELLKAAQDDRRAEVGGHLHPWCAPPFVEALSPRNSYLCNLPSWLQREKLARLTDGISAAFGRSPLSFRAGRYGLDHVGAAHLEALGYTNDSSVISYLDYRGEGGPDFRQAPFVPYHPAREDLCRPGGPRTLLEAPVSVGYLRGDFQAAQAWRDWATSGWRKRLRLAGIADRLGLVRRVKFSPEQHAERELIALANRFHAAHAPCLVLLLHSSSLLPGYSPYVPTAAALDAFYDRLAAVFEHCLEGLRLVPRTLAAFAAHYAAAAPARIASEFRTQEVSRVVSRA